MSWCRFIAAVLFLTASGPLFGKGSTSGGAINIRKLGAMGDGVADDTPAFEAAAGSGRAIFVPSGTYVIQKSISLPSGARWVGEGDKSQITASGSLAFSIFTASGSPDKPVTHIQVRKMAFQGKPGAYALDLKSVSGVEVIDCTARELGLLRVGIKLPINIWGGAKDPAAAVGLKSGAQLSQRIWVEDSECLRTEKHPADKTGAIELGFLRFATVQGCKISGYHHGIKWWGGDSNFKRGGHPDNERWCQDLNIRGNTVSDVSGAGIWGSMGKRILVERNTVERCGDVGIDFEGCLYSEARDNFVRDARNGCLAVFYVAKNITFRDNECRSAGTPLMRVYNARPDSAWSSGLKLENNRFINEGTGLAQVGDYTGSCADALVMGNYLENATMAFASKYTVRPRVIRNKLIFHNVAEPKYAALTVSSAAGRAEISGNTIIAKDSSGRDATGVRTHDVRPLKKREYTISHNTISGFKVAVRSSSVGGDAPPLRLVVSDNKFLNGIVSFPALKKSQLTWSGNRNSQGLISAVSDSWFER